jgi:hypothetical protein
MDDSKDYLYLSCAWLCCHALQEICFRVGSVKNLSNSSELVKQLNWLLVRSHSSWLDLLYNRLPVNKKHAKKRCFYLSSLLRSINKDNNFEVFDLQESVCQKLVQISPCNSYFLYLLGNAKLEKFDGQYFNKNNELKNLLNDAENLLLASIDLEEKMDNGEAPDLITGDLILNPYCRS